MGCCSSKSNVAPVKEVENTLLAKSPSSGELKPEPKPELPGAAATEPATLTSTVLVKEMYNGKKLSENGDYVAWLSKNMTDDCVVKVGEMEFTKEMFVGSNKACIAACPDFTFEIVKEFAAAEESTVIGHVTAVGTHTGEPFAIAEDLTAMPVTDPPFKCKNDDEKLTFHFSDDGKISKLVIEALPGGRGFSGPSGWYKQMVGKVTDAEVTDAQVTVLAGADATLKEGATDAKDAVADAGATLKEEAADVKDASALNGIVPTDN